MSPEASNTHGSRLLVNGWSRGSKLLHKETCRVVGSRGDGEKGRKRTGMYLSPQFPLR